ncbi:S8 family serine peptidase [Haloprofundus sp. MHR1]|uniref:S8 family peptidase n=1 Tax=Haloprofundus sp. MHR1 TaxID=2572921 RepID=UPI0010BF4857|nr:S8 family serine peptidase [Haloprofundus sp. MHR1]QCJ47895.1 peptidase S8/S53 subtilisin kexin sedolisin [Haloprofundus sp. MHR1]
MDETPTLERRTVLKLTGAASLLPFAGRARAGTLASLVDDTLDTASDALQEVLVVFESNDDVGLLDSLELVDGYHEFSVLPVGFSRLTGAQIATVADWDEVRYVEANRDLEYFNDDGREVTRAAEVQSDLGYAGENAHVVVIDSGIDGDHPDLAANLDANYQWVGDPLGLTDTETLWLDAGALDTDEIGHGTHCSGTVAGDGSASDGQYKGMAPAATLTSYSTSAGLSILKAAAAFDHMLENGDGSTYQVVSNSYGASSTDDFDPNATLNVASWYAYQADILPVFAAGNSGPGYDTLNDYAKAPHVLGVAATDDQKGVTDFSSRGRDDGSNYDRETALSNLATYYESGEASGPLGIYRTGVAAPGNEIVSTMSPDDPLGATTVGDGELYYASISGTSMACPHVSGIAALVVDAHVAAQGSRPTARELLATVEAEAEDALSSYEPASAGAGFVDAYDAVERAEGGDLATLDETTLV